MTSQDIVVDATTSGVLRRPGRRCRADWLRAGFLVAVVVFGVAFVSGRRHELGDAFGSMSWGLVAVSAVPAAVNILLGLLAWRTMLADLGAPLSARVAGRVFLLGQLGKYLPGSVWSFIAQAELARDHSVSRKITFVGSVLGLLIAVGTGVVTACVTLPFGGADALARYWWVVLVVPLGMAVLHPRVVGPLLDRVLRFLGRGPLERRPSFHGMLTAGGWYLLGWLALGMHCWLLMLASGAPAAQALPVAVGGLALAFCLGVLFLPAPAGAGIREIVLVLVFASVLAPAEALAIALVSRIMLTVLDFVLAGAAWQLNRPARVHATTEGT
jgi:glycosyltransferase 2 family protein